MENSPSIEEKLCELNLNLDVLLKKHDFKNLVSYAGNDPKHVMYTVDNTSEDEEDFDLISITNQCSNHKPKGVCYPVSHQLPSLLPRITE